MKKNTPIYEQLKSKYHKTYEITNFKDMLYRSATLYKSRPAFKLKNENGQIYNISYEQFKKDVIYLGTTLLSKGLKNKKICIIGKNSYKWVVSYLAASIVGIVVPLDKELHNDDIINFMNISECSAILGDNKILKNIFENTNLINPNILYFNFDNKKSTNNMLSYDLLKDFGKTLVEQGNVEFDNIKVNPDEMKILLFTSGTTGNAKGVCLSQRNICSNILSIFGIVYVRKNETVLSILPLHHTYECTIGFLLLIYSGGSIAFCDGLRYITKNINEYHPSVILCVPLLLENVHKKIIKSLNNSLPEKYKNKDKLQINKLPFLIKSIVKSKVKKSLGGRLRMFIVGAAAANPIIVNDFDSLGLRTLQGYGLTECSPLVAGNTDFFSKDDACGLPIPNVEYKIDNPDEDGVGEIIVKGPNVMLGYYNDKEATDKVLKNGWFYTGDLGKIDENGYLYITGRCKSVIVTKNGKNIYPEEIEYYLNDNPLISESLVLGIKHENDDETYISAQIFPNIEAIKDSLNGITPSKEEVHKIISNIIKSVNSNLPNYKHIKSFNIRDEEFEKTTTQKIKRFGNNMKIDKKM